MKIKNYHGLGAQSTSWFRQGDPIFVYREVSQDLEVIESPKFQRLRNLSFSRCREIVQNKIKKYWKYKKMKKNKPFFYISMICIFQKFEEKIKRFWIRQSFLCRFQKDMGLLWSNLLQSVKIYFSVSTYQKYRQIHTHNKSQYCISFWSTRNLIGSRFF